MHLLHSVWNRLARQDETGRGRKKPKQNTLLSGGGGAGRAGRKGRGSSSARVDPNARFLGDHSRGSGAGGAGGVG
jgi:hypothetical protein